MTQKTGFDWDGYIERTSYSTVLRGMEGNRLTTPTMFSPDGSQVYLKSLDIACRTDDVERLNGAFREILDSLRLAITSMTWSCERVYLCQVDYLTVWGLLDNLSALPEDYRHPEHYLEEAWREYRRPSDLEAAADR